MLARLCDLRDLTEAHPLTALLNRDRTNFALACNNCGQRVANLADTAHHWDLAWVLLRRHGWTGAALATGPHACPRCAEVPEPARPAEQAPGRARSAAAPRRSRRIVVTEQPVATVVEVRGELSLRVKAALHDLLIPEGPQRRHVIVDLSGASTLDSGAVDLLVRAQARAARNGFTVCLAGLSGSMRDALRLLCLDRLLPTFANRAEALAWLDGQKPDRPTVPTQAALGDRAMEFV